MRVRSLAGAVKLPMRGKSCNIRSTLKMAADVSKTQAARFLGSELHEDGPVQPESAVGVEPLHPRASPEPVEGAPGKTLAPAKKQRVKILGFIYLAPNLFIFNRSRILFSLACCFVFFPTYQHRETFSHVNFEYI